MKKFVALLLALALFVVGAAAMRAWDAHTLWAIAMAAGVCGYLVFYGECAVLLSRLTPKVSGWVWLLIVGAFFGVLCPLLADGTRLKLDDIFVSPLQLAGIRLGDLTSHRFLIFGLPSAVVRVFIGPLLAALPGIWFLVEGCRKFRTWRAPEPIPAEKEKGEGIVKR